jgi:hypothetical protein
MSICNPSPELREIPRLLCPCQVLLPLVSIGLPPTFLFLLLLCFAELLLRQLNKFSLECLFILLRDLIPHFSYINFGPLECIVPNDIFYDEVRAALLIAYLPFSNWIECLVLVTVMSMLLVPRLLWKVVKQLSSLIICSCLFIRNSSNNLPLLLVSMSCQEVDL